MDVTSIGDMTRVVKPIGQDHFIDGVQVTEEDFDEEYKRRYANLSSQYEGKCSRWCSHED